MKFKLDLNEIHMLLQAAEGNVKHDSACRHVILKVEGNELKIYQPNMYAECSPSQLKAVNEFNPA